jgi:protein O-GlcNAc transferase
MSSDQTLQLAIRHHQAGRLEEADRLYQQILQQNPENSKVWHLRGVVAAQSKQLDRALESMQKAIAIDPDKSEYHNDLGNLFAIQNDYHKAESAYLRAIELKFDFAEAHYNLAINLNKQGKSKAAADEYRIALRYRSDYPEAYFNLGAALAASDQLDEAVTVCRELIRRQPKLPKAHMQLGNVLTELGKFDEAFAEYHQARLLIPDNAEVYFNLGTVLKRSGNLDQAIIEFHHALQLQPDYPEAHLNLGATLSSQGKIEQAIATYRRTLQIQPGYIIAQSNLLYALHFDPAYDATNILREHVEWARQYANLQNETVSYSNDRSSDRRLRIGYVSPDFRTHVVGRHILPLLENHDRQNFEIFCYFNNSRSDALTDRLRSHANHWRDVASLSDQQLTELIKKDRIDILIDLTMHMAGSRLLVFARKPAPIQITYLAYVGTTGLSTMDYRLSDSHLDPPGTDGDYLEKTIRLPHTYWCYQPGGPTPQIAPLPALKTKHITFGCLNNFTKVSSAALDLWMQLLQKIPASRLILHALSGSHREATKKRFAAAGVDPQRIEFVGTLPWEKYIDLYNSRIDIALDPTPYGGGITSLDALWMGVPLVTLRGETGVGRGGCSILSNLELPELIASSHDEYVRIAADLAGDLPRLSDLRATLRQRMIDSPLMDAKNFARDFENIYRRLWREWCATSSI